MYAGGVGAGAQKQAQVFSLRADQQMNFVALRLRHAVDAATDELFAQFAGYKAQRNAVKWHKACPPNIMNESIIPKMRLLRKEKALCYNKKRKAEKGRKFFAQACFFNS